MQRLCRIGVTAAVLALVAATAQADPFTLNFNVQITPAEGASWFSNAVRMDEGNDGPRLFLIDSFLTPGGERVSFANGAITFNSTSASTGGFSTSSNGSQMPSPFLPSMFLGGSINRSSSGLPGQAGGTPTNSTTPGFDIQVPGAGAAYNPFNPDLGGPGGTDPGFGGRPGAPDNLVLTSNTTNGPNVPGTSPVTFSTLAVPTTPEPSPLLLLAAGLAAFLLWKKRDALKGTSA